MREQYPHISVPFKNINTSPINILKKENLARENKPPNFHKRTVSNKNTTQ